MRLHVQTMLPKKEKKKTSNNNSKPNNYMTRPVNTCTVFNPGPQIELKLLVQSIKEKKYLVDQTSKISTNHQQGD